MQTHRARSCLDYRASMMHADEETALESILSYEIDQKMIIIFEKEENMKRETSSSPWFHHELRATKVVLNSTLSLTTECSVVHLPHAHVARWKRGKLFPSRKSPTSDWKWKPNSPREDPAGRPMDCWVNCTRWPRCIRLEFFGAIDPDGDAGNNRRMRFQKKHSGASWTN